MSTHVPFVDLRAQHDQVRDEIEVALKDIINRSSFIGGDYVKRFEREFAEYLDARNAVGVGNGTDALWLALVAVGVKPGDAVITAPNTFIATTEAISRAGAQILFVDIDIRTSSIDIDELSRFMGEECTRADDGSLIHRATGRRIGAILPVHLYGLPVDMSPLMALAADHKIPVVEDACQAHGATYCLNGTWKRVGSFGHAAAFSFYPGKNLGAMGDAGAVVTNDPALAEQMRLMRDHGSSKKYIHVRPDGANSRLDAIQAAVLSIKLKRLDEWNSLRRRAADCYTEFLSDLPLDLPVEPEYARHVYHLYVVHSTKREMLRERLEEEGIGVGLHYPIPLHLQDAYADLGFGKGSFPKTEQSATTLFSLPMHPMLTQEH